MPTLSESLQVKLEALAVVVVIFVCCAAQTRRHLARCLVDSLLCLTRDRVSVAGVRSRRCGGAGGCLALLRHLGTREWPMTHAQRWNVNVRSPYCACRFRFAGALKLVCVDCNEPTRPPVHVNAGPISSSVHLQQRQLLATQLLNVGASPLSGHLP